MPHRRPIGVVSALVLGSACILGAGAASVSASAPRPAPATAHRAPPPATLVIDQEGPPATLDPGLQWDTESYEVYRNIFDQLVSRNPKTNAIEPHVALSWKAVTPTQWRFVIRSGIKFTNGEPLTAADVAYSLNRILNPKLRSAQAANFTDVKGATAKGNVVTIQTTVPDPTLLSYLHILSIVPMKYIQQHGNAYFNLHPVGSGPYELQQWIQGSKAVLTRNPQYWSKKGVFPTVVFRDVPNAATRVSDLESGEADLAEGLTPDQVAQLKGNSTVKALAAPEEFEQLLLFNTYESPTNSAQFRQAVSDAINVPLLVKTVMRGYAESTPEVLAHGVFGYNSSEKAYTYSPTKARALLKAAHYNGAPLTFLTFSGVPSTLIEAVQAELSAVGIKSKIQSYSTPTYLSSWQNPKHNWGNLNITFWSCSCEDASGLLFPLFTTGSIWSSVSDPALDKLISAAQDTIVSSTRTKAINNALSLIRTQMYGMGLWQSYGIYGAAKHLQWTPDLPQDMFINTMSWK